MSNPVDFEGSNDLMLAPKSMPPEECGDLPIFNANNQIISCFRLTDEELEIVKKTGCVWLSVFGQKMPPVMISGKALVNIGDRPSKPEPYIKPAPRKG